MKLLLIAVIYFGCNLLPFAVGQQKSSDLWALSQWQRKIWQIEDGLPNNYVTAITQDAEGRLIVGTESGIVTFDGFSFSPYPVLADTFIYSLLQASDGTLWVGTYRQGLYRVHNGFATKVGDGSFFSLTQRNNGQIWAVSDVGAGYIVNDRLKIVVPGSDTDGYGWQPTSQGNDGSLWFAAQEGLRYSRNPETNMVIPHLRGVPVTIYTQPQSHELLLGTTKGLFRLTCEASTCASSAVKDVPGPVVGLRQAADQSLWVATWGHGLYRISRSGGRVHVENMDSRSGLADDFVRTMYEDGEHNMWIGTRGSGLIRFRTTTLKPYGMSEQLDGNCASTAIGDGEGGVWLGTWRSGLFHWTKGRMERRQLPRNRLDILITALAIDSARNLWIGSFSIFWVLRHGHQHAEIIPGRNGNISLRQIFFARDKSLWIISSLGDLSVYQSGDPATSESRSVLAGENVRYISQDRVGVIWLGTTNGLWQLRDIHSAPVPVAQSTSPVLSIFEDRQSRLWTTYEDGNMNVRTATGTVSFPTSGFPNKKIYKVMEDLDGNFWFSSGLGPVWISGADVDGAIKTPGSNIKVMKMGIADGARTIECRCADNPQSWMSSEGRMWIPTAKGFVEANPGRIGKSVGPNTYIKSIQWEGRGPTADRRVKLPAGSHNLEIHFSAIRPGAADGVSFRYRLEGTDDKWIEAGKDRTARYTQVAPGNHRFLVAARDAMGEWGASSEADVEQQPHLYETLWFECGMIALLLVLMMTIYILRLRGIHKRYDAVLCERSRIAREWHDTLLVGLSAVAWQLDAAIHICTHSPSLISLANARNMLRYCSDEARLAVEELRIESILRPNIEETLRAALQQLTLGTSMTFELDVNVTSPLSGQISRDLLRICQEATANAIQHGKPSKISVSLHSVESRIILSIHDDGVGMAPSLIQTPPPGHFGLMGMRERVQRIGGRLEISSFPGQGTTVKAEVPLTL